MDRIQLWTIDPLDRILYGMSHARLVLPYRNDIVSRVLRAHTFGSPKNAGMEHSRIVRLRQVEVTVADDRCRHLGESCVAKQHKKS